MRSINESRSYINSGLQSGIEFLGEAKAHVSSLASICSSTCAIRSSTTARRSGGIHLLHEVAGDLTAIGTSTSSTRPPGFVTTRSEYPVTS